MNNGGKGTSSSEARTKQDKERAALGLVGCLAVTLMVCVTAVVITLIVVWGG